jgi:hypothetical protein
MQSLLSWCVDVRGPSNYSAAYSTVPTCLLIPTQLRPTPIETPSGPKVVTLNIDELAERIAGLPQLRFERRLQSMDIPIINS